MEILYALNKKTTKTPLWFKFFNLMRAIVKSKNQSSQVTNLDEPFNYNKNKEIVCIIYLDDKNVIKEVVL